MRLGGIKGPNHHGWGIWRKQSHSLMKSGILGFHTKLIPKIKVSIWLYSASLSKAKKSRQLAVLVIHSMCIYWNPFSNQAVSLFWLAKRVQGSLSALLGKKLTSHTSPRRQIPRQTAEEREDRHGATFLYILQMPRKNSSTYSFSMTVKT